MSTSRMTRPLGLAAAPYPSLGRQCARRTASGSHVAAAGQCSPSRGSLPLIFLAGTGMPRTGNTYQSRFAAATAALRVSVPAGRPPEVCRHPVRPCIIPSSLLGADLAGSAVGEWEKRPGTCLAVGETRFLLCLSGCCGLPTAPGWPWVAVPECFRGGVAACCYG